MRPWGLASACILAIAGMSSSQEGRPGGRPRTEFETEHFRIASARGVLPDEHFPATLEDLWAAWTSKLGGTTPGGKMRIVLHFNADAFHEQIGQGQPHRIRHEELHVLCDEQVLQHVAAGGTRLYVNAAYPKVGARTDLPPWIFAGLGGYFASSRAAAGKLEMDSPKIPDAHMNILSLQNLQRSPDGYALERALRAEGRDYEIRRRVVDLEAWGIFYFLFNAPDDEGGRGKNAAAVPRFLAALEEGRKPEEALKELWAGGASSLDRAVRDYFQKLKAYVADREEGHWLVGETAHYVIYVQKGAQNRRTKATDRQILQDLKFKMELLFEKYALAFRFQGRLAQKATLRLYKDRSTYLSAGAPPGSAAYYNSGSKELVGYEDSAETGIVFQILCHEGCHQFFDLAFPGFYDTPDLPMWFSEGLADCFGASEIRGRDLYVFTLGGVAAWRVDAIKEHLQTKRTSSLKDLLAMNRATFMARADVHYPQSWSFVHFLWNYPTLDQGKGQYSEIVIRLLDGFKVGKSRAEVYQEAFQVKGKPVSIDDLEREWKEYVKKLRVRK